MMDRKSFEERKSTEPHPVSLKSIWKFKISQNTKQFWGINWERRAFTLWCIFCLNTRYKLYIFSLVSRRIVSENQNLYSYVQILAQTRVCFHLACTFAVQTEVSACQISGALKDLANALCGNAQSRRSFPPFPLKLPSKSRREHHCKSLNNFQLDIFQLRALHIRIFRRGSNRSNHTLCWKMIVVLKCRTHYDRRLYGKRDRTSLFNRQEV